MENHTSDSQERDVDLDEDAKCLVYRWRTASFHVFIMVICVSAGKSDVFLRQKANAQGVTGRRCDHVSVVQLEVVLRSWLCGKPGTIEHSEESGLA